MRGPRDDQPGPDEHRDDRDQREQRHPGPGGHPGQEGELVGVGHPGAAPAGRQAAPRRAAAPPWSGSAPAPRPAAPRRTAGTTRPRRRTPRAAPGSANQMTANSAPPVMSTASTPYQLRIMHQRHREQQQEQRQQQRHPVRGEQRAGPDPEQRRRDVPGHGGDDDARPVAPAPGDRLARGVRVQPDALQLPPGQQRGRRVAALVRDRDRDPRRPPQQRARHDQQRDEGAHGDDPFRRGALRPDQPIPEHRHGQRVFIPPNGRCPSAERSAFPRFPM